MSTGALGYPMNEVAIVALSVLQRELFGHPLPTLVRIVLSEPAAFQVFTAVADRTF
jgi:O-acetyl-ADP-ribose deacetylase (regulator of RNase III)